MTRTSCPLCRSDKSKTIAEFPQVPVLCNALFPSEDAAKAAGKGDIDLTICADCAMIWNAAFDESAMAYSPGYENALHHSVSFQDFARDLVGGLIARHDLKGRAVFEVGCGDGYMLREFVNMGAANGIGFDPSMKGRASPFADGKAVTILPEAFDPTRTPHDCALALCRHVLEHIEDPVPFLDSLLENLPSADTPLYFEVPNSTWLLAKPSPWDVVYEHVGYWTGPSLARLFASAGLTDFVVSTAYNDQFLQIETARREGEPSRQMRVDEVLQIANSFAKSTAAAIDRWNAVLSQGYERVVIWGGGSKGITFTNFISQSGHRIRALIDQNPLKHGMHIPGTGTQVLPPESLSQIRPDLVVIANGHYEAEITKAIKAMDIACAIKIL